MKNTDRAWAAGLFDGEGCVRIRRQRKPEGVYYSLIIDITQSSNSAEANDIPAVTERLKLLFSGAVQAYSKDKKHNRKPRWSWRLATRQAEHFLRTILPYAVGKKSQIELAIEFREKAVKLGKTRNVKLQEHYYREITKLKFTKRALSL